MAGGGGGGGGKGEWVVHPEAQGGNTKIYLDKL